MILEYHRPKNLEEAHQLLNRSGIASRPLGGGTAIDRYGQEPLAVVDLQDLNLSKIERRGNWTDLGATVTLQTLLESTHLPAALSETIRREASYNLRQVATVAGTLVSADGRSPFTTAMLALDAMLTLFPGSEGNGSEQVHLGDFLSFRKEMLEGRLITQVTIPSNAALAYKYVARTPADRPVVCAAVARWPSGRTRAALGGYGPVPALAMDGPEADGAETAARNAYTGAGDEWASAAYREEVAGLLVRRSIEELS
jgi:putative selenate reductase FAD-binding subunit